MTNTKPTLRSNYEELSALVSLALENGIITSAKANDYTAFINGRIEQLAKKNAGDKKPTANQVANEGLKTAIVEGMEAKRVYTVSELMKVIPELAEATNQKVTALLRQLVADGAIVRTEDKRKAFFALA